MDPDSISFDYCRSVLQKRWGITCRHGGQPSGGQRTLAGERWQDVGEVDPVKAVLISEG